MKEPHLLDVMYQKRVQMTISIVGITLGGIALFAGSGYMIDTYFDTKPIFLLIFLAISFPVTQLLLYKRARQIMKDFKNNS